MTDHATSLTLLLYTASCFRSPVATSRNTNWLTIVYYALVLPPPTQLYHDPIQYCMAMMPRSS